MLAVILCAVIAVVFCIRARSKTQRVYADNGSPAVPPSAPVDVTLSAPTLGLDASVENLLRRFPQRTAAEVEAALVQHDWHAGQASNFLINMESAEATLGRRILPTADAAAASSSVEPNRLALQNPANPGESRFARCCHWLYSAPIAQSH